MLINTNATRRLSLWRAAGWSDLMINEIGTLARPSASVCRYDFFVVRNDTEAGYAEDIRLIILIDSHNDL
jgi:hypothetical protein